jgi:pseudouridylate synthase / pseudouridine kinase
MDVSADLHELARCSVGLVSAGVKSILDIGRYVKICFMLFILDVDVHLQNSRVSRASHTELSLPGIYALQETLGVPVVSYAESNDFPAFYTRKSGSKVCSEL